ncbi:MAG: hypothetical protein OJF49_003956 [Ktedonobacterales bacterium]|nr:MAG: hypothetical protein OJF49_003956 [Ktedonobacterales bacterium]
MQAHTQDIFLTDAVQFPATGRTAIRLIQTGGGNGPTKPGNPQTFYGVWRGANSGSVRERAER